MNASRVVWLGVKLREELHVIRNTTGNEVWSIYNDTYFEIYEHLSRGHSLTSSADKTHLVSLGGRPETAAIRVFNLRQEWLLLMRILIFFVLLRKFIRWDENRKSDLLSSSYVEDLKT